MPERKVIFRTGKSWELIMVTNLLREREIPFSENEENPPDAATPTTFWTVLVPEEHVKQAKKALSELPININRNASDIWDSGEDEETKRNWKLYALGSIIAIILGIIITLILKS